MSKTHAALWLILIAGIAASSTGCAAPQANYVHTVFFTFKADTPPAEREAVWDGCRQLAKNVPTVRALQTGFRDKTAANPVNVQDFDLGLIVYFDDKAGYDAYEVHPFHKQFVETHKKTFEKVRVLDFVAK